MASDQSHLPEIFAFDKCPLPGDVFPVSFSEQYRGFPSNRSTTLRAFEKLLEPVDRPGLERMAQKSASVTRRYYGRTMRLFAPLYVSNECVNNCQYCGFSRDNPILRTTLTVEQVVTEARHLHQQGFRNILLVAGEHPKFVSEGYLQECITAIKGFIPTIGIEVGPMEDDQYRELVQCGAEGLVVYQETYHRETYEKLHTAGPKKKFDWRLECPERAYAGGFRRIGIGALFGLADWRWEALSLAAHLEHLLKHCWKAQFTIAFPRMRPHAGNHLYQPKESNYLSDRHLVQLMSAFRITFPQVGIVVSTREPAMLRNSILSLGATHMSAGSHTEPGGYTGAGCDDLHRTIRGRRIELETNEASTYQKATPQFEIDDLRNAEEFADYLRSQQFDPVWKDWDEAILTP